ncbi:MAG: MlaC/ttg2D family ABC transporter substrate-binding protein [Opitutaceae bacterium]
MKFPKTLFIFIFLGFLTALSAKPTPREILATTVDEALEVVYGDCCVDTTLEHKQQKVRELLEARYDVTVLIRRAIGRNWKLMNEQEQGQVLELVKQLVVKTYVKGLNGKGRPEVTFGDTVQVSDKRLEVPSTVVLDGKTFYVTYRMGLMHTGWEIFDIVAEDISVVSNYRQQFDDHFRKGTGAELVKKLEELLQKDDLDEKIEL